MADGDRGQGSWSREREKMSDFVLKKGKEVRFERDEDLILCAERREHAGLDDGNVIDVIEISARLAVRCLVNEAAGI